MPNALASFLERRRFRPTLWPTLGLVLLVGTTVSLGNWQRHRAAEKSQARDHLLGAAREPPLELSGAVADPERLRFRSVRAIGEFDAAGQLLIDNRVHAGRVGYHVVTPFKLVSGDVVLVDRGWIAQRATRAQLPEAPPPMGRIVVEGRINMPPARYLELGRGSDGGRVWQNLDIGRIAKANGLSLLPFIIEQTGEAGDGLARDWPQPDFGIERHQSYMVQWYSLALLGCILWLSLNWRARPEEDESG